MRGFKKKIYIDFNQSMEKRSQVMLTIFDCRVILMEDVKSCCCCISKSLLQTIEVKQKPKTK